MSGDHGTNYSEMRNSRRWSTAPRSLNELEEDFLTVVEAGDVAKANQFVKLHSRNGEINFKCSTYKGLNAMKIAVQNDNEEMVHFLSSLLDEGEECTLMYAIEANKIPLVENICASIARNRGGLAEMKPCLFTNDYPPDVTPIMLAAILGHFEIIGFLIRRGHSIDVPHPPDCFCKEECIPELENSDLLELAGSKLRKYTAISNPAYFVNITDDPIKTAFKLYESLNRISNFEMPFRAAYVDLADKVANFAADLIGSPTVLSRAEVNEFFQGQCRNSAEVKTLLKQYSGLGSYWMTISQTEVSRLIMAMDYRQKKFVAQPNVQIILEEKWLGEFVSWKHFPLILKIVWPLGRLFLLPYAYFVFLVAPKSSSARYYASPVNKMISFLASYVIFLTMIFCYSFRGPSPEREGLTYKLESFIILYVVALTATTAYQCLAVHPKRFFNNGWNQYDVIMIFFFWLTFAFWFANSAHYFKYPKTRGVERKYWSPWDPELMAEGFFVVASIMAYCKVLQFFQANYDLGPMQVALDAMVNDCARYSLFAVIILLAYTCGMSKFYSYYKGMSAKDPQTNDESEQENSFVSFLDTFKNLYWSIFGLTDESLCDVVIESVDSAGDTNEHIFTQGIGYFVLGSFMVLMTLIIVNMLVATMSETYANIISDVHTQWLFGRSEVFIYYLTYPVLPPPLNLLPQSYSLYYSVPRTPRRYDEEVEVLVDKEDETLDPSELARTLVMRYFSSLKIQENDD